MNLFDEWLHRLRTTEYEQGYEYLCQRVNGTIKFSAYGLLCEAASLPYEINLVGDSYHLIYQPAHIYLPPQVIVKQTELQVCSIGHIWVPSDCVPTQYHPNMFKGHPSLMLYWLKAPFVTIADILEKSVGKEVRFMHK